MTSSVMKVSTVRTSAWDILKNLLTSGTYKLSTTHIYSAYNDTLLKDVARPIVIIPMPHVMKKKARMGGTFEYTLVFNIKVFHSSAANLKALADELDDKLTRGEGELREYGLQHPEYLESDTDFYEEGKTTTHIYNMPVQYTYTVKRGY